MIRSGPSVVGWVSGAASIREVCLGPCYQYTPCFYLHNGLLIIAQKDDYFLCKHSIFSRPKSIFSAAQRDWRSGWLERIVDVIESLLTLHLHCGGSSVKIGMTAQQG